MADIFWDRLEPHTRDPSLEEGLQERIADPLWLLARQWQVGEFRGEDAASPIHLRATVQHHPLSGFRNDSDPDAPEEPFPRGRPLESRVEAEALRGPGRTAAAATSGLQLLRRLDDGGLQHLRSTLREAFPLEPEPSAADGLPSREQRRLALMASGSLDGLRAFDAGRDAVIALAAASDQDALGLAVDAWRTELQRTYDLPGASGETWISEQLDHAFAVTARAGDDVVLEASQYPGGRLDWHAFDVAAPPTRLEPPGPVSGTRVDVLPVRLTYAGMPASSHWELEEGAVSFGGLEAGPADLARLLVAEFALVYSDDYFLFPLRLPAASIARVAELTAWNAFGERFQLPSAARLDALTSRDGRRPWALFELTGDRSAQIGSTPWLLLVPALTAAQNGPLLESVSFVRDEEANLAWAIEERIETVTGGSVRRRLLADTAADGSARPQPPTDDASDSSTEAAWRYRLQSPVPPYWIPLAPEPLGSDASAQIRLRRARLLAWEELPDPSVAGPKGRVLEPDRPFYLREEEIPVAGVQITRRWQLARGADGRPHLWLTRRKRTGRGERGSGLRYDQIER